MNTVIRKVFVDFEKEESFLNKMSAKGWALKAYSWCKYEFEEAPNNEYIYRIELLEYPVNHPESHNYIRFMEETGVEMVTSYGRWVYFRRKAADGQFDLYSDIDSRMKHYNRILTLFYIITGLNLFMGIYNFYLGYLQSNMGFSSVNTLFSILSFTVVILLVIFVVLPITQKVNTLRKEKQIQE